MLFRSLPDIPEDAVAAKRRGKYSTELLVRRARLSGTFDVQPASLEDIMLFIAKKGERK